MRIFDVIKKKKQGLELTKDEIDFFIQNYVKGEIKDYQASALLMAICLKGMTENETKFLTFAMRDSGDKVDLSKISGVKVDKHSTGGVGDKTSLIIAPILASLGLKVAKMSGRGLGHTGGTIDKLESIDGYNVNLSTEDFINQVNEIGISIIGQTKSIAIADKKLYALRDATATIDSVSLVVSSIMSKKLAVDDDVIVLDVKTGSGAFCKTIKESVILAQNMVNIGKSANKKILAVITDMDIPLGKAIGNNLEVIEAIEVLKGKGPKDLKKICIALSSYILQLSNCGDYKTCEKMVKESLKSKKAFEKFKELVRYQQGDVSLIENPKKFKKAKYFKEVISNQSGFIQSVDTENYGVASLILGAGRNKIEDSIDYTAGIILNKKTGDFINKGETLLTLYTNDEKSLYKAEEIVINSTIIGDKKPKKSSLIKKIIR